MSTPVTKGPGPATDQVIALRYGVPRPAERIASVPAAGGCRNGQPLKERTFQTRGRHLCSHAGRDQTRVAAFTSITVIPMTTAAAVCRIEPSERAGSVQSPD
jgi:hypothetical protein